MSGSAGVVQADGEFEVRLWREPEELERIDTAAYWNDEALERGKEWWILDGDVDRMERYIEEVGLGSQLRRAVEEAAALGRLLHGSGADLGAGNLWAVPRLLAADGVERVYAVEFSAHRLLKLGPALLRHYGVAPERVVLCLGSFTDIMLPDSSLDFVLLSQALHHASDPVELLAEVRRVLNSEGVALVIGEHVVGRSPRWLVRWAAARVLSRLAPAALQRPLLGCSLPRGPVPVAVDPVLGDHYYPMSEYARMFRAAGFRSRTLRDPAFLLGQAFVLVPEP